MSTNITAERTILRKLISERGLRQDYLASKIGVTQSHFTRMLNRERPMTAVAQVTLAELLDVSLDTFSDGERLLVCIEAAMQPNDSAPPSASADEDVSTNQVPARAE